MGVEWSGERRAFIRSFYMLNEARGRNGQTEEGFGWLVDWLAGWEWVRGKGELLVLLVCWSCSVFAKFTPRILISGIKWRHEKKEKRDLIEFAKRKRTSSIGSCGRSWIRINEKNKSGNGWSDEWLRKVVGTGRQPNRYLVVKQGTLVNWKFFAGNSCGGKEV